jgi:hypothetical protein
VELPGVPSDTTRNVARRQIEGLRRLGPEGRLEQTLALCRAADELARAGIELRHGRLSEPDRQKELARLRYGSELVTRVEAYCARRER